ncbi:protein GAMETE EXPRESSED 2 [Senna tora]|uniref:Lipoamide acyltransferase component of branched-chain alpha-keto acid dehydrogenase complex, mitochondrial n=1 Tax=Senna tora TaxID=362788 RepID=A0A834X4H8_9FABA|nr:protein GAMETE EXPRESSED 2 [Senna tora]
MLNGRIWQRTVWSLRRRWFCTYVSQSSSPLDHYSPLRNFYSRSSSSSSTSAFVSFTMPKAKHHINFNNWYMKTYCFSTEAVVQLPAAEIVDVPLAQTGEGIAECELLRWFVEEGDQVEEFQPLCEVQSDKATIEITSRYKGKVTHLLYVPGDIVKVGETLLKVLVNDPSFPTVIFNDSENANSPSTDDEKSKRGGVLSTPAVRSLAKQHGIDINDVCGTGKDDRVLKEDVLNYAVKKGIIKDPSVSLNVDYGNQPQVIEENNCDAATAKFEWTSEDKIVPLRGFQRAMVKTMSMAAKVPHFHYVDEITCDALVELKTSFQNNNTFPDVKHTFLPLLIKSLSMAIIKYPLMNSCFNEESMEVVLEGSHNIGIAMATPYGLVVPSIKNVQSLSILEITKELSRLQKLALDNKLNPEDICGGTITLSNIGAIGGKFGSPLLNLPEVSIIAIGRIQKVPQFAEDGSVYPASLMTVNIGADHRVLDGATVARFCNEWKQLIENPELLMAHNSAPTSEIVIKMAVLTLRHIAISLTAFSFSLFLISCSESPSSDKAPLPKFVFSWWDDKDTFQAGDTAAIKVRVLENADKIDKITFKPTLTVNGKAGNSCYVSTVLSNFEGDPNNWSIIFTPIRVGLFNVLINDGHYQVYDSSLHFQVEPGNMYPSVCVASWKGLKSEFEAGAKVTIMVLLKDAFGNRISKSTEVSYLPDFNLSVLYENGSIASPLNISNIGWNEFDYMIFEFVVTKAGNFSLRVEGGNQTLNGSPLPLKVNPGPIDVSNCMAKWNFKPNAWQLASKMEILIHQQDQYGNLVPGLYAFDAEVVERETNLSIPVADLHFEEVNAGIQLFSFGNWEPGNFFLTIYDSKHNKSISNMPYAYTVFVGYCDKVKSVINGSGLNDSVAGVLTEFSVYLNDIYQYPSPVEAEILQVLILRQNDSYSVSPTIYPMLNTTGSNTTSRVRYDGVSQVQVAPSPTVELSNYSNRSESSVVASAFRVEYTPEKSGTYEICVYCGNILLNGGHSIRKEVRAGEVNISLSGLVLFSRKVPKLSKNEVVVHLLDSYSNPVLSEQSRLKLEIASINSSGFSTWDIVDNKDGEYFPKANNDTISIWEDESIAIDALANDYFAGAHGSIIQKGRIFRYTPYEDYYGKDSFWYTISDVNGNLATASLYISILSVPLQFASVPTQLQATEDLISPRFGGFTGFEITYSDLMENISVNLSVRSGSILLSPMLMQFRKSMWSELTINKGNETANNLILEGSVEVINLALQSIQYLGNENFCGEDAIRISTKNKNGMNALDVPILVDPINDPPFIRVPYLIILRSNTDESLIFDREEDKFDFFVGDPDLLTFPGGETQFLVTFSVEVTDGLLVTNLPADLINTTELKIKNSNQWQPLQTYVTISKHFMVKANGIRFQGTLNDCNTVMLQLFYHGGEHGAVLTLTLNDMGNYGCYPDCAEGMSMPLYAEAMVNLMRRRPMSSLLAHTLGSAIIIEFVIILCLGVWILYFTCKCAFLLVNERRNRHKRPPELPTVQRSQRQTMQLSTNISENCTHFTGCCSSASWLGFGRQSSNFRQRSRRIFEIGESSKTVNHCEAQHDLVPSFAPLAIEKDQSSSTL